MNDSGTEISVLISPEIRLQTIAHFGVSSSWWAQDVGGWDDSIRMQLADLLFSVDNGIGISLFRYNIGAGKGHSIEDPWRYTACYLEDPETFNPNCDQNALWFAKAAHQRGVNHFVAFAVSPPAWLTKENTVDGRSNGASNLSPESFEPFADYLVRIIQHLKEQEGLPIQYLSPINEPEWDWNPNKGQEGCHYETNEIVGMTEALIRKIQKEKLTIKVSVVEAGEWKSGKNYLEAMLKSELIREHLDHFSLHSYWSNLNSKVQFETFRTLACPQLPTWMSEWTEMKTGRDFGMDSALTLANTLHEDLTHGQVISWQYWIALSKYDFRDGLIYVDPKYQSFQVTKRLWALGHFSKFIRPGFHRISITHEIENGINMSAFTSPDQTQTILVAINNNYQPTIIQPIIDSKLYYSGQMVVTSESQDLELTQPLRTDSTSKWSLPPRSISTIIWNNDE